MVQTMFDSKPTQTTIQISDEEKLIQTLNHARADKKAAYAQKIQEYKLPQIIIDTILNNPTAEEWRFPTTTLPNNKVSKLKQRGSIFAKEVVEYEYYLDPLLIDKLLGLGFVVIQKGQDKQTTILTYEGEV